MNYLAKFNVISRQFEFTKFESQWTPTVSRPLSEIVPDTADAIVVGLFCERSGAIWIKAPVAVYLSLTASANTHLRNGFTVVCPVNSQLCLVQDFTTKVVEAWEKFNTI